MSLVVTSKLTDSTLNSQLIKILQDLEKKLTTWRTIVIMKSVQSYSVSDLTQYDELMFSYVYGGAQFMDFILTSHDIFCTPGKEVHLVDSINNSAAIVVYESKTTLKLIENTNTNWSINIYGK